jgi:hypothetical protein
MKLLTESILNSLDLDCAVVLGAVALGPEAAEGHNGLIATVLRQKPTRRAGDE